ncbi:MAG: RelA/SpoT domain-containing protein [Chloroflexi bacterium]|nr:RelA/SpoT domain-containing protein [Chloroflexota bacterium]
MTKKKKSDDWLRRDCEQLTPLANKYALALREQFEQLLITHDLTLGVPIEYRVKTWDSISEKTERLKLSLSSVRDLDDFIGLRLILLFTRDITKIHELISETFEVIQYEDTGGRLAETQFGYQSVHYAIGLPQSWLKIPSFREFGGLRAEVQVRTLAQHIWATASHKLQYKQATSVPPPVIRSIHRVSAILETVDLEFERVLQERDSYITSIDSSKMDVKLNVDLVQRILDELLPSQNKMESEPYANLLQDLLQFDINTAGKLRQLTMSNLDKALEEDRRIVTKRLNSKDFSGTSRERCESGVFYTHVGLAREAAYQQFGERWEDYKWSQVD